LNFTPYDYQENAVKSWLEIQNGIFKFATGSGKTKTAIYLMHKLKKIYPKNFFIIVVPDKTLVYQWSNELLELQYSVTKCMSDMPNWYNKLYDVIDIYLNSLSVNEYVVVSADTFFTSRFQKLIEKLNENYLLVVDECHMLGSERRLDMLPTPKMRLGLSATPELFFSVDKTKRLLNYFGGVIAEYSLEQAIRDGKLVGYEYHPIFVKLSRDEKERYKEITKKIVKILGYDEEGPKDKLEKAAEMLLFKRARIVYGAEEKLYKLQELLSTFSHFHHLLIYCGATSYKFDYAENTNQDSETQLNKVNEIVKNMGIVSVQYTQKENARERENAITQFKSGTVKTLVAIKCLDEGVNIPEIETAVILSSSSNPREFIQRRGRLLRKTSEKEKAVIYDMVVLEEEKEFHSMNKKEIERVYEFSSIALNREQLFKKLDKEFNLYIDNKEEE
jgi:superfamily II DNA or RNA helicase